MKPLRTFVAVEIAEEASGKIDRLIKRLSHIDAGVKWVAGENLHLTLKFLGDVPAEQVPEICDCVTQAAAGHAPFKLECCELGAFPDITRPRTVWVGAGDGSEVVQRLQESVESGLDLIGFRPERRRFHPHLTIGRARRGGPGLAQLGEAIDSERGFQAGQTLVDEVVVFSSELGPGGPTYTPLARVPLG